MKPSFDIRDEEELTGRHIITFHPDAADEGLELVRKHAGLAKLEHSRDYPGQVINTQADMQRGGVFDELDICVVSCAKSQIDRLDEHSGRSAIMKIEPEHRVYAMDGAAIGEPESETYLDSANESWGVQATRVTESPYSGAGIRVAVLDSGIDALHPDFAESRLGSLKAFLGDGDVDDQNGHGTHCAGVIAGSREPASAPVYATAPGAEIFIGKVVGADGLGDDRSLLAGINWALANKCDIVSMSIGATVESPSFAFEQVGRRALARNCLIVAAAGNNAIRQEGKLGFVNRPANNVSILAVGAVDRQLAIAPFSVGASKVTGGEVDIVGPGVEVFSAWTSPEKYRTISGTSMATPFVAGVAALHAEAGQIRGRALWDRLEKTTRQLPASKVDVGAGLVQAPV